MVRRDLLNHEVKDTYTLVVRVTDDGVSPDELFDTATITLKVLDVNEAPVLEDAVLSVPENSAAGVAVGAPLQAVDEDEDPADALAYTIISGNDLGLFSIGSSTGAVVVSATGQGRLNHEEQAQYSLVVKVVDEHGLSDTADIVVKVADVNEAPVLPSIHCSVKELASTSTAVCTLSAVDEDYDGVRGMAQALSYEITGGNTGGAFSLTADPVSNTATIVVSNSLDYETLTQYSLAIRVTDDGIIAGNLVGARTVDAQVPITVVDENEPPTIAAQDRTVQETVVAAETGAVGTAVGAVLVASDPDTQYEDRLVFKIVSGDEAGVFSLSKEGQLTLAGAVDFEAHPVYQLLVSVTDAGFDVALSAEATITVALEDVQEAPVATGAVLFVDENSAAGTTAVGATLGDTVSGSDVDAADAGKLTFSITGGSPPFEIDAVTGAVAVADSSALNFETTPSFTFEITVTDTDSNTDTATVTVNLNDVNEVGCEFGLRTPCLFC